MGVWTWEIYCGNISEGFLLPFLLLMDFFLLFLFYFIFCSDLFVRKLR